MIGLVSCGNYGPIGSKGVGALESTAPRLINSNSQEHEQLSAICQALQAKAIVLSSIVNRSFIFGTLEKDCSSNDFMPLTDVQVSIVNQGFGYTFRENGGNNFYFSDVETHSAGVMANICPGLSNLTSPIVEGDNFTFFTTEGIAPSECPPQGGQVCVKTMSGVRVNTEEGVRARIHTVEYTRFKLDNNGGNRGFFTYKRRYSSANCEENQEYGRSVFLK